MAAMTYVEHEISTSFGYITGQDHPGGEDAFVLLHRFPDDLAIYSRLIPELSPRRVVTFGFVGYGQSEQVMGAHLREGQRLEETAAVIDYLGLDKPVAVGPDAGGPVAVEYAAAHPSRVSSLVLLN